MPILYANFTIIQHKVLRCVKVKSRKLLQLDKKNSLKRIKELVTIALVITILSENVTCAQANESVKNNITIGGVAVGTSDYAKVTCTLN